MKMRDDEWGFSWLSGFRIQPQAIQASEAVRFKQEI